MKILKYLGVVILVLAAIFFARGILTPSVDYVCEITVDSSAGEAWAVMNDESKLSEWITGYSRTELLSGTPNTVGAVSNVYVHERGEEMVMKETIKAIIPNKRMAMSFAMDFMNMDYDLTFTERDGMTHIKSASKAMGNGLFAKSMVSFMQGAMKDQEQENMGKLKTLIEGS